MRTWHRELRAIAALLLAIVVVFWKLLTHQFAAIEGSDFGTQVVPWLQAQASALRAGSLMLWDPYLLGGQPLAGQLQPAVFSPLTWCLLAAPFTNGHLSINAVHYWFILIHCLAGLFSYAFLRDLRCSRPAAVLAAVFFATSGLMGNTIWPQIVLAAAWMPLVLLFGLRSLGGRRPMGNAALAGFFLGLSLLSGYHAIPMFIALAIFGIAVAAAIGRRENIPALAGRLLVMALCAASVSAIQVLPTLEYARYAVRWVEAANPVHWGERVPYSVHQRIGFSPSELLFLIVPGGGTGMINPIAGVVPLSLSALALAIGKPRRLVWWFAGLGLGAFLFSMSRFVVFHGVLYSLIPGLDKAREPILALVVFHMTVAVLAGIGFDALRNVERRESLRRGARWLLFCALGLFALALWPPQMLRAVAFGADRCAMAAFVALFAAALTFAWSAGKLSSNAMIVASVVLLLIEVGNSTGFNYVHREDKEAVIQPRLEGGTDDLADFLRRQPGPARADYSSDEMLLNLGDWYGIETMTGWVPSVPERLYRLGWFDQRVRNLYGIRYNVARKAPSPAQPLVFTSKDGWKVFENAEAFPRAWAVHNVSIARNEVEAVQLVKLPGVDLRTNVVLTAKPPSLEACGGAGDRVEVSYRSPQTVALSAVMECAGVVLLSDNAFPGWRATVDGRPAEILHADVALRGVVVPKGKHEIIMRYRPSSVLWGAGGTLAGLIAVAFLAMRRERDAVACWSAGTCVSG